MEAAMPRRPFLNFLVSSEAIQVHLVCLLLIVLLSYSLWTGDAQPDYGWGLLFTVVVYPVILGLMWWSEHLEQKEQVEHAIASVMDPDGLRRRQRFLRRGSLAVFAVIAAGFIYAGHQGLRVDFLPAQYLVCCQVVQTISWTLLRENFCGGLRSPPQKIARGRR
jgi:hypothetical protein